MEEKNIDDINDAFGKEIPRAEVEMWMKKAHDQTPETLAQFLKDVRDGIPVSYGNIVHKMAISAIATTWAVDHSDQGGITGFQAGCVMWEYIQFWMSLHHPLSLIDYENMLYPQYEDRFTSISKETFAWMQKRAREILEENKDHGMHPNVREHMERIIMGQPPFGFRVRS